MRSDILAILDYVQGMAFQAVGPFLVADLSANKKLYRWVPVAQHGMEQVCSGQKTEPHQHDFISVYKSVGLNVMHVDTLYTLPDAALTIVLPGVRHSWVAQAAEGRVGSVDQRHQVQIVQPYLGAVV